MPTVTTPATPATPTHITLADRRQRALAAEVDDFRAATRIAAGHADQLRAAFGLEPRPWPADLLLDAVAGKLAAWAERAGRLPAGDLRPVALRGLCRAVIAWAAASAPAGRLSAYMRCGAAREIQREMYGRGRSEARRIAADSEALEVVADRRPGHDAQAAERDEADAVLEHVRARAGERVALVMRMVDLEGYRQGEVAGAVGVTRVRVCQLRAQGLRAARTREAS